MADGTVLNAGTGGDTIATDDIGGVKYELVKQVFGPLDTATLVTVADAAHGLPTQVIDGANATQGAIADAIVAAGATGSISAKLRRISQGLEDLKTLIVLGAGTAVIGHVIADSGSTTAVTGNVTAVQATGSNLHTVVDSGTISLPTGASTAAKQPALGTAGSASADVISIQGIASMTKLLVTPDSVALPANQSVNVAQVNGVTTLMGNGNTGTGSQRVTIAADNTAFSVNAVESGTWTVQPGNTPNTSPWLTQNTPATSGGLTTAMFSGSDGSTILVATAQVIKASAGQLYGYYLYNPEAAVTFVHFYNTAQGSVTVGTTNPLFSLAIPAGSAANLMTDTGIPFSNAGWSIAATTTAGGNTAPGTGVSAVVWYK